MIRFQRPQLPTIAATEAYYAEAEEARWYSNFGPCHEALVARAAALVGEPVQILPVANCTLGLMIALRAVAGGRTGTEVIVPSYTFVATGAAIDWAGLTPVFVDVDPAHWSLDPAQLDAALDARGDRVAAVLACTTFGAPPPLAVSRAWEDSCRSAGVPLVVDSASGFGSIDAGGRLAGHLGDVEVFSFHATKPSAIGEGGLLSTSSDALAADLRRLANFGLDHGSLTGSIGFNAKLAEWPAATALAMLDELDGILAARRATAASFREELGSLDLEFQQIDSQPAWQFFPALAPNAAVRDAVVERARHDGVEIRTYFDTPLHAMPAFAGAPRADDLAVTNDLASRALSLPMANDLTDAERQTVVGAVSRALTAEEVR